MAACAFSGVVKHSWAEGELPVPCMKPEKVSNLMTKGDIVYVDVRTVDEFAKSHAPGAVNVEYMFKNAEGKKEVNPDFIKQLEEKFPDKTAVLVMGCGSGGRSSKACALAKEAGYTALFDLADGFGAWEAAGLPVEK